MKSIATTSKYYEPSDRPFSRCVEWIKRDRWNYYEAACLFCGAIPEKNVAYEANKRFTALLHRNPKSEGYCDYNQLMMLFEAADWPNYGAVSIDQYLSQDVFFNFALSKQIKIPDELLKLHQEKLSQNNEYSVITPGMLKTIQPVVKIIEEFKLSEDFEKHGTGVQQGLIKSWLAGKG